MKTLTVGREGDVIVKGHDLKSGDEILVIYTNIPGTNGYLANGAKIEIKEVKNYFYGWSSLEEAKKYPSKMRGTKLTQMLIGTVSRFTRGLSPQGQVLKMATNSGLPFIKTNGSEPLTHAFDVVGMP